MVWVFRRLLPLVCGLGCASVVAGQDATIQHWQGMYPVAELPRFPEDREIRGVGYIADAQTWAAVWTGFETDPVPIVDFGSELVVYARNVDFVNLLGPLSVSVDTQGFAEVIAAQTLTARPIEDFVYWSAATIPADDVRQLRSGGQTLAVHIPEPSSLALAALGLFARFSCRRGRQRSAWVSAVPVHLS